MPIEKYFKTLKALAVHNFLNHLYFLHVGEVMLSKYGHLMVQGAFPDKVSPDIDCIVEAVVQFYVLVVKTLL